MANILSKISNFFNKDDQIVTEGSEEQRELLTVTMEDVELVREIDSDIENSKGLYADMKTIQDENEKYYLGKQLDKGCFDYELPTDQNILYRNLETILSIITSKRKEPIVLPAQDTDESKELRDKNQQYLSWKWSDEDMSIKYEDWARQAYLYRIGVLKVRWDLKKDDYVIELKRPQRILIDKDATDEYDSKFIVEFRQNSLNDLIDMFPKRKGDLMASYGPKLGTLVNYIEYWTNDFVVFKVGNIILAKKPNPNWNWDEKDRKQALAKVRTKMKTKDKKLKNVLLNYFNEPRKPYIILSLKNLGKTIYADTTDFEQAKVGQDIVNRRKRQIDKASIHALGRDVISGSYISKDEAKKMISNPNSPIWLEKGNANDAVTHISPQVISPVVLQDLQDTKQEMDSTMGAHGTTRGEQGSAETATGRNLLREGDLGRIDLAVRRIDKKLELLYGWMVQMAKVYYDDTHFIKLLGAEGAADYLEYSSDDIEDGMEIIVKSEMTAYKATQRAEAQERMAAGLLDPLGYMEAFEVSNPKEQARRMVMYALDPKLYLATFLMDENTPGAETTSVGKAQEEQKAMMDGEMVPPFQAVDRAHLEEHGKFIKKPLFQRLEDVAIKSNFQSHIQQEIDQLKQLTQSVGPSQTAHPMQQQQMPMQAQPMAQPQI